MLTGLGGIMMGFFETATPFVPSDLSGLILWVRADVGVTESAGVVHKWADNSGHGNDYNYDPENVGHEPVKMTNRINGQTAINFDSDDPDYLYATLDITPTVAETFIVTKTKTADAPNAWGLWDQGSSGSAEWYSFNGDIYEEWGSTGRVLALSNTSLLPGGDLSHAHVLNVRSGSGTYIVDIDGVNYYTSGSNTVGFPGTLILGKNSDGSGFAGDIAEHIIYDNILSSDDRTSIMTYLRTRYGTP